MKHIVLCQITELGMNGTAVDRQVYSQGPLLGSNLTPGWKAMFDCPSDSEFQVFCTSDSNTDGCRQSVDCKKIMDAATVMSPIDLWTPVVKP